MQSGWRQSPAVACRLNEKAQQTATHEARQMVGDPKDSWDYRLVQLFREDKELYLAAQNERRLTMPMFPAL